MNMHRTIAGIVFKRSIAGWVAEIGGSRILLRKGHVYPWVCSHLPPVRPSQAGCLTSASTMVECVEAALKRLREGA